MAIPVDEVLLTVESGAVVKLVIPGNLTVTDIEKIRAVFEVLLKNVVRDP